MFENLYTFKKTSWHVKLFTWIYGESPIRIYKSMCPYFWTYVLTILFLPFILVVKLFNKSGTKVLNNLRTYKERKKNELIAKLILDSENLKTDEECYYFSKSNCYKEYTYMIDYNERREIERRAWNHYDILRAEKLNRERRKEAKIVTYKESKYFTAFALLVSISVFGLIGYLFYSLFSMITFRPINWDVLLNALLMITALGGICLAIYLICKYLLGPLVEKIRCMNLPKCTMCKLGLGKYLLIPFKMLGNLLLVICNMIYVTYKKNCPMITWEDEKE